MFQYRHRRPRPTVLPTLRGLRVKYPDGTDGPGQEVVYPWQEVEREPAAKGSSGVSLWRVYDEDGNPRRENGRPLLFSRYSPRLGFLADRTQARSFRRAWGNGDFVVKEHYGPTPPLLRILSFFCVVSWIPFVIFLGAWAARKWQSYSTLSLPTEALLLTRLVIVLIVFVVVVMGITGRWYLARLKSDLTEMRLDRKGVWARKADGRQCRGTWERLLSIEWLESIPIVLRFNDGTELRLGQARPRLRLSLQIILSYLRPEEMEERRKRARYAIGRAAVWWFLGAVMFEAIIYSDPVLSQRMEFGVMFVSMMFMAGLIVGAGLMPWILLWVERTLRLRRRRRKRASRSTLSPA